MSRKMLFYPFLMQPCCPVFQPTNMAGTVIVEGQSRNISIKLSWKSVFCGRRMLKFGHFFTLWCRNNCNQSSTQNVGLWTVLKEDQQSIFPVKWNCQLKVKVNSTPFVMIPGFYDFIPNQYGLKGQWSKISMQLS